MRKKRRAVIISLVLLLAILGGGLYVFRYSLHFPMWRLAEEPESNPERQVEFVSLEEEEGKTKILVNLISERGGGFGGSSFRIDYRMNGKWYTVYESEPEIYVAFSWVLKPGQKNGYSERVPQKVTEWEGRYRLYIRGWNCCEFEVN